MEVVNAEPLQQHVEHACEFRRGYLAHGIILFSALRIFLQQGQQPSSCECLNAYSCLAILEAIATFDEGRYGALNYVYYVQQEPECLND